MAAPPDRPAQDDRPREPSARDRRPGCEDEYVVDRNPGQDDGERHAGPHGSLTSALARGRRTPDEDSRHDGIPGHLVRTRQVRARRRSRYKPATRIRRTARSTGRTCRRAARTCGSARRRRRERRRARWPRGRVVPRVNPGDRAKNSRSSAIAKKTRGEASMIGDSAPSVEIVTTTETSGAPTRRRSPASCRRRSAATGDLLDRAHVRYAHLAAR